MTTSTQPSQLTIKALAFARKRHAGQRRAADGAPFVKHPIEVATLLADAGYPDHVVAAGVLHDVLEDTEAEREELEAEFGPEVAELVACVSDDPGIEDHGDRKAALRRQVASAGEEAAAVFAADKVSKARELRLRAARETLGADTASKREHYAQSLELLDELLPGNPLVRRLRMELELLDG